MPSRGQTTVRTYKENAEVYRLSVCMINQQLAFVTMSSSTAMRKSVVIRLGITEVCSSQRKKLGRRTAPGHKEIVFGGLQYNGTVQTDACLQWQMGSSKVATSFSSVLESAHSRAVPRGPLCSYHHPIGDHLLVVYPSFGTKKLLWGDRIMRLLLHTISNYRCQF